MNDNIFEKAFDAIDDEFIAEAKSPTIRIAARRKKIIISSVAACVAAVLTAIPAIKVISDLKDSRFTTSDDNKIIYVEEVETVYVDDESDKTQTNETDKNNQTNETIENQDEKDEDEDSNTLFIDESVGALTIKMDDLYFINNSTNGSTTTYEKIYAPNLEYLYINPIPTDEYVTIYENYFQKEISETEAKSFADRFFPQIADALGITLAPYEVFNYGDVLSVIAQSDNEYKISLNSYTNQNIIGISSYKDQTKTILLDETITVNQTKSDAEIMASLSGIKQKLFNIYGVSFDSAKIVRHYNDSNIYGVNWLDVYFYNSVAHPLNDLPGAFPYTDHISISFNNNLNSVNDIASATDLYNVFSINYRLYSADEHTYSKPVTKIKLLQLEKAEEYLNKGYVLAMGGCSLCQAEQTPIDFSNYDYVSLEYKGGSRIGDFTVPYYAFYKNIGTSENGNMVFAKTYVPAIEVEGYEEYFENEHASHNIDNFTNTYEEPIIY